MDDSLENNSLNDIKKFLGTGESGVESLDALANEYIEKVTTNIGNDTYDRLVYESLLKNSEDLAELSEKGEEEYAPFPSLLQDIFDIFYKRSPEMLDEELVEEDHHSNRSFLEEILGNEDMDRTKASTRFDEVISAATAISTGKKILEIIEDQQQSQGQGQGEEGDEEGEGEGDSQGQGDLNQEAKNQIKSAMAEAAQESEEMAEAAANWGLDEDEIARVPMGDRLKFAEALSNKRLKYLANLVGKAMNFLSASKIEKVEGGNEEIKEISFGGDLSKVLPQELVLLRHPKRKKEFLRRYADNQLLSYEMLSNERQNRGPLVILVDISYSMDDFNRIDGAIATSLALVNVAVRKQKRRAIVKFFNTSVQASYSFSPSDIGGMMKNLREIAEIGVSGGTGYIQPINEALAACKGKFSKADILMLTDGQCDLSPNQLEEIAKTKKEKNIGFYTVLFEEVVSYNSLENFSDEIYQAKNLIDDPELITKLGSKIGG